MEMEGVHVYQQRLIALSAPSCVFDSVQVFTHLTPIVIVDVIYMLSLVVRRIV